MENSIPGSVLRARIFVPQKNSVGIQRSLLLSLLLSGLILWICNTVFSYFDMMSKRNIQVDGSSSSKRVPC